jgi:hypothetical protein
MSATQTASPATPKPARSADPSGPQRARRPVTEAPSRHPAALQEEARGSGSRPRPTDDEILGIETAAKDTPFDPNQVGLDFDDNARDAIAPRTPGENNSDAAALADPENLRAVFDANPELRRAWQDAQAYRETFATPEEARTATGLLADLDRMDALFFSRRPEDHAELARAVASLDPAAFASLAQAMTSLASNAPAVILRSADSIGTTKNLSSTGAESSPPQVLSRPQNDVTNGPTYAQTEFFHAANAAAVEGVLEAIESQVDRLLPEGISKSARNRVVGEIYRELDTTLRANRQLGSQMREAFRSGSLDADHQNAIVSLVSSRARQALPGVAKRVLNEWTSTLVAANQERRARQRTAERRVDIAGSGGAANDGRRSLGPRDIDYARMSDSDILNL